LYITTMNENGKTIEEYKMPNSDDEWIKYSKRMRSKYLSLVRRIGKNRAIGAIARILLEKNS